MADVIADKLTLLEKLAPIWDVRGMIVFGRGDLEELRTAVAALRLAHEDDKELYVRCTCGHPGDKPFCPIDHDQIQHERVATAPPADGEDILTFARTVVSKVAKEGDSPNVRQLARDYIRLRAVPRHELPCRCFFCAGLD